MPSNKIKPKESNQTNLSEGIRFRISGEAGKTNGILWSVLDEMGTHLQELIKLLAKYNLEGEFSLNLKNFEIELFDFKAGSAVPGFRLRPIYTPSLDEKTVQQRNEVSEKFNEMLQLASTGAYEGLKEKYKMPEVRSEIAYEFFKFTSSAGNSPISVVKPARGGKFIPIYDIKRPKRHQYEALVINHKPKTKKNLGEESSEVFGKIQVKATSDGKSVRKIVELYEGKDTAMSFAPIHIVAPDKTYHLHTPIMCLLEKEEDYFIIQSDLFDLYAAGATINEAEDNFYKEFDLAYQRFNEIPDEQLSDRLKRAKQAFKLIVKEITQA